MKLITDEVVSAGPTLKPVSATLFGPSSEALDEVFLTLGENRTLRVTPKSQTFRAAVAAGTIEKKLPSLSFSGYYRIGPAEVDTREAQIAALGAAFYRGPTPQPRPPSKLPSAYVYFAQFIAHELSRLYSASKDEYQNLNTAKLDLDTVLWPGQTGSSAIKGEMEKVGALVRDGVALGRTSKTSEDRYADIPRSVDGAPRVPDCRSDANLALAQLHVAIVRHYVNLVDRHGAAARRCLLEEIHQITLYDFLPRIIRGDIYDDVMANGRRIVMPGSGDPCTFQIPIEFAAAAFRFGHTLVRHSYFWSPFDPDSASPQSSLQELTHTGGGLDTHSVDGHRCLDTRWEADWSDMIGPDARNYAPRISAELAPQLTELPAKYVPDATDPVNLAGWSLERGRRLRLPSAQTFRSFYGSDVVPVFLSEDQIRASLPEEMVAALLAGSQGDRLVDRTPLWFYVIKEAEVLGGGYHLGPIGGRIVMETIHAAICASVGGPAPSPYVRPFTLRDLLTDLHPATSPCLEDKL